VQAISGSGHVCALLDDDTVKCWGQNEYGQVGRGSTGHVGDGGGEMGDALPVVNLGTGRTVTAVSTGGFHTCALLDNGQYKCWGYNGDGGLGLGDTGGRGGGAGQMGDALPAVRLTGPSEALTCDGQPVTVDLNEEQTPTAGADVILGTPGPDTINALGGLDRICGGGGVDTVNAGPGNDRVFGQAGNDALTGGTGNDRLDGGTQNDTLNGGDGTDTLLGGLGGDTVNGGNQADTVFGGDGNDRLNGQNHNDTLNGQVGADTLDGGANNDRLNGGGQRDTCHGRAGTDSQSGCEVRTGIP
jgi:Ca2+-binding RTX toxin-like protein